ncbi:MAG: phage holin family protein [Fulvivirga sp.]|nr:phage holin family protein [Fulvivirga sp.]
MGIELDNITEHLKGYIETKFEIHKLEVKEKLVKILAKVVIFVLFLISVTIILTLLSIGASIKINLLLKSDYLGFLIVAGVYALIILCMRLFIDKDTFYKAIAEKMNQSIDQKNEH